MDSVTHYFNSLGDWLITSGFQIVIILMVMLVAMKMGQVVSAKIFDLFNRNADDDELKKRTDTLKSIIRNALNVVIFAVCAMMILKEIGIDIAPIMAAAGVVGLAVGFGARNLVEDVISGFFILMEDQIRVGDVVEIEGKGGLVERITLRLIVLRDLAGNVHFIRNGSISKVTNMTKEYSRYVFDIGVAYREDVDEVIDLIKKVDDSMRNDDAFKRDILEPIEILGLDKFGDSALIIKARTKTRPIKQWNVAREFNKRLKKIFDENDIEIPFPHRTLYMGVDKQGKAPVLNVNSTDQKKEAQNANS